MKTTKEILDGIPDKYGSEKNTTSLKWKEDVIEFFRNKELISCLELGTWHGRSTRILSEIFKDVWTVELVQHRVDNAREFCKDKSNITFVCGNAYLDKTYRRFPQHFDVVVIDCDHTHSSVIKDIERGLSYARPGSIQYFVFDDYGHSELEGVHTGIKHCIKKYGLRVENYIGHPAGTTINRGKKPPFTLFDYEGLIVSSEK